MPSEPLSVAEQREYLVLTVHDAKRLASLYLAGWTLSSPVHYGLPEIDDRYHVWRVPLLTPSGDRAGEIVLDGHSGEVDVRRSTGKAMLERRLAELGAADARRVPQGRATVSPLPNTIMCGDSAQTLAQLPAESVDLVFTSPPYYNARPDYSDYSTYDEYLESIRNVIRACHRTLHEGRFFVMNVAPVLVRRARRSESSRRIAVPFDMHRLFTDEGFDFVDDIIWEKPEGAGWATGRGRRFAADRNPLQYKAVPVTEYILVYRKRTSKLIDWHIRTHPDPKVVERSKIRGTYERTNIWRITPVSSKEHPAIFPVELAERVVRYYSFEADVVLDPFAGIGTVGQAASRLDRRFVLSERDPDYVDIIRRRAVDWLGAESAESVACIGCGQIDVG